MDGNPTRKKFSESNSKYSSLLCKLRAEKEKAHKERQKKEEAKRENRKKKREERKKGAILEVEKCTVKKNQKIIQATNESCRKKDKRTGVLGSESRKRKREEPVHRVGKFPLNKKSKHDGLEEQATTECFRGVDKMHKERRKRKGEKNKKPVLAARTRIIPTKSTNEKLKQQATKEPRKNLKETAGRGRKQLNMNSKKEVEERRRKNRDKKRRQRQRILANPEALEKSREYERKRNQKRKASGEFKSIREMTRREQIQQRKKWRESAQRHKEKIAQQLATDKFCMENSPPCSPERQVLNEIEQPDVTDKTVKKKVGRKKIKANRAKVYKKISKLEKNLKKSRSLTEKWKKRYARIKGSPSPRKSVKALMKRGHVKEISKRLLFSEALVHQLKKRSSKLHTEREKQVFAKCISGRVLKKYKCVKTAALFISPHRFRKNTESASLKYYRKKKATAISDRVKNAVREYLEEDINSCMAPGKRDTLTLNGIKKQKRYLLDTLENLHSKFVETTKTQMSYVTFTRNKPFWIVKPKVCGRDTCLCIKCANADFVVDKLHMLKLVKHNKAASLAKDLCCSNRKKECSYGECQRCKDKSVCPTLPESQKNEQTSYNKWTKKKEDRVIGKNKKAIQVNIVYKEKVVCSVEELLCEAEKQVPIYLQHSYNAAHQYFFVRDLKNSLLTNEAIILIDFSENFVCKYASEVQSVHFGASKSQVYFTLKH